MHEEGLREALKHLREEINQADPADEGAKARLNALITGIEKKLEHPDDEEHHETLVDNVRGAMDEFRLEHPRATSILNRIMFTLGEAGL